MAVQLLLLALLIVVIFMAWSDTPPQNVDNSCDLFAEKRAWYRHAQASEKKWGTPIPIQLAIIYQESRFIHHAKTPREKYLWFLPGGRQSSAYGYAQVINGTWEWYLAETGHRFATRDDFADVTDFIGWYGVQSQRFLGIKNNDSLSLYLAYHEGHHGYRQKTYRKKPWLMKVAREVQSRAKRYEVQLKSCQEQLDLPAWRRFFL